MFNTLQEAIDYLSTFGYNTEPYCGYLDSLITDITLVHPQTKNEITIFCRESDEYEDYLKSLPDGTEFTTDFSRCEIDSIFIGDTDMVYPSYDALPYDSDGGIMIPNSRELLDIVLNVLKNKSQHVKNIYLKHFENVDNFLNKYHDLFEKNGIVETYNSILDVTNKETESSNPTVCFGVGSEGPFGGFMSVWTDALTGEFCGDIDDVEELVKEELQRIKNYTDVGSKRQG